MPPIRPDVNAAYEALARDLSKPSVFGPSGAEALLPLVEPNLDLDETVLAMAQATDFRLARPKTIIFFPASCKKSIFSQFF